MVQVLHLWLPLDEIESTVKTSSCFPPSSSSLLHPQWPPSISLLLLKQLWQRGRSLSLSLPLFRMRPPFPPLLSLQPPNLAAPRTMVGYALTSVPQKPAWLEALLSEKFFVACAKHANLKKNERNIYCIDCSVGICQHCLSSHSPHRLLQIRRYVYHDVIRLQDIQRLVDCGQVQTYIINSARVVFLNQRPQPRPSKGLGNTCETCERSLQDAYRYCSVACKVDAVLAQGKDIQILLPRCNNLHLIDLVQPVESQKASELDSDEQFSPNSILEAASSSPTSSGSTANDGIMWENDFTAATNLHAVPTKKMRSRYCGKTLEAAAISPTSVILPSLNRRKGTPHRSPFC